MGDKDTTTEIVRSLMTDIVPGLMKSLAELNASFQELRLSTSNLPDKVTLKSIESTILLESQKQHNDLACTEDIQRFEDKVISILSDIKSRVERLEYMAGDKGPKSYVQTANGSEVEAVAKAILDANIKEKELDVKKTKISENTSLAKAKDTNRLERLKSWLKFWPLFAAGLFELVRWVSAHWSQIIFVIKG